MTNRKIAYWVIPPKANAEFVAHMEEVLETYAKPYDPACPVLSPPLYLFELANSKSYESCWLVGQP